MSALLIRPASKTDIKSIVKIRLGALKEEELVGFTVPDGNLCWSIEKLKHLWDKDNRLKDNSEVFVAEGQEKVIGFIVLNMGVSEDIIDNIIVAKEEQGKGVGRALVAYVEKLVKSRGFDVITTDTTENSKGVPWKAYGFWKKMGYEDTGERISSSYDFRNIPLIKRLK
jgi:ribosomal protein S18 acetylase RimI-like enzyme